MFMCRMLVRSLLAQICLVPPHGIVAMPDLSEEFNLQTLSAPIAGDRATGIDLRQDFSAQSIYYQLRDARAEARSAERTADADSTLDASTPAQWRVVRKLTAEAIATQTKDLELAAWFTEALLRSDGLPGLRLGFALLAELVELYWDDVYPLPDEEGLETRLAPIAGLNGEGAEGTLIQPLRKLPFLPRPNGAMLAFWQYEQAVEVAGIGDAARRKQRLDAGALPLADVEREAQAAGQAYFRKLRSEATDALAAWEILTARLEQHAGPNSTSSSRVRDLLSQIIATASRFAPPDPTPRNANIVNEVTPQPGGSAEGSGAATDVSHRPATREDALLLLDEVASFFRSTEPHSPLAYTLHEAVRRARLPWPELLEEIVPDEALRSAIRNTLGIRSADT
jgi:type VI secretion system protein ImpA